MTPFVKMYESVWCLIVERGSVEIARGIVEKIEWIVTKYEHDINYGIQLLDITGNLTNCFVWLRQENIAVSYDDIVERGEHYANKLLATRVQ